MSTDFLSQGQKGGFFVRKKGVILGMREEAGRRFITGQRVRINFGVSILAAAVVRTTFIRPLRIHPPSAITRYYK